ncbi:MAG: ATPase [Deltaproteobacteria bacterium]|nr:ATPase [Deltaproteobacteria bacterium]
MNLAHRLLKAEILTPEQLAPALYRQKKNRGFLAKHLLDLKLLEPEVLDSFIYSYPPIPKTLEETGLTQNLLIQLLLKHAYFRDTFSVREMVRDLKIGAQLVETLISYLKTQNLLFVRPRDVLTTKTRLSMELYYALTDQGKGLAEQALEANRYIGPAPVPLEDYWDWVEAQTIHQVRVEMARLREVFADFEVSPTLLDKIGPAVNSGRSIFLFGPSGNGKTVMSNAIGQSFEDPVYIPAALYVYGQIIRVFDEVNHQPLATNGEAPRHDPRWVLCRRPVVIVGGELTEDSLELRFNPILKFYEAPHQLRANNGVFIIDDFGRQKMSPRQLLNRWMYPLETRQDFCCLHTGQQFGVPFDQLIIFSTNLNPHSLADEAFLRRIRHKIFIGYVTPSQYLTIFHKVCREYDMVFDEAIVREMMYRHYVVTARPLSACHPRDLVQNLVDRAAFLGQQPQLTADDLENVCQTYFIKQADITDYDTIGNIGEPQPLS